MDPATGMVLSAGISALANTGGGFMSASGAAAANQANQQMNWNNLNFQNNVNNANWEHQQAVNAENWVHQQVVNAQNWDAMTWAARENAGQASLQREFQERMSRTAYARAMDSMRDAGLNPILAYQQGGGPLPQGAAGGASNAGAGNSVSGNSAGHGASGNLAMENTQSELGRAIGRAAQSAVDAYRTSEEIQSLQKGRELTEQKTKESEAQTHANWMDAANKKEQTFKTNAEIDVVKAMKHQVNAHTARAHADARRSHADAAWRELQHREARPQTEGGHGRGTGVGPNALERTIRGLEDLEHFGIH